MGENHKSQKEKTGSRKARMNSGNKGMNSGKQEANFAIVQNFCYGLFLMFSTSLSF